MTSLFMAITTLRDVSSVTVWAVKLRIVPLRVEVLLWRPKESSSSHDQLVEMTNSLAGLCQLSKSARQDHKPGDGLLQ